jgi:hypothetical protein
MTVVPHPIYVSLFLGLKIKLKGSHFDTIEMIEAQSLAALNTQNSTSMMYLKMTEALGTVHIRGRGLLRGSCWPVDRKLVFDQMAAPVPEIMEGSLYGVSPTFSRNVSPALSRTHIYRVFKKYTT